jgi:hypothetical protein
VPDTLVVRPRLLRMVAWVAAVLCVAAAVAVSAALSGPVAGGREVFGAADRVATVGLGLIGALAALSLTRPRVEADAGGVRVRNVVTGCHLPWQVVHAVRFDRDSSWATLELRDGDVVALLAVQAVDRQHAVVAVRELRALHAAHQHRDLATGGNA